MSAPLILASRSAARAALLAGAGVIATCIPAGIDEAAAKQALGVLDPKTLAERLAEMKAQAVSLGRPGLVLGCDQTLEFEGELFDKPESLAELRRQLTRLRGRSHTLHSAMALARGGSTIHAGVQSAILTMREFSDAFLDAYIAREGAAVMACVGGYRLESLGAQLFARIEGDYFTVLGLPLLELLAVLRDHGVADR